MTFASAPLSALVLQGVTPPLSLGDYKLIAFEMDGTLLEGSSLELIAAVTGQQSELGALRERTQNGELSAQDYLLQGVALFKGTPISQLQAAFDSSLALSTGASTLLTACKTARVKVLIVSRGFTLFSDRIKRQLDIDFVYANTLQSNGGVLTGQLAQAYWGTICDDEKRKMLLATCYELGIEPAQSIAVGRDSSDLSMLGLAGLSVAFHGSAELCAKAMVSIDAGGLEQLLDIVRPHIAAVNSDFDLTVLDDLVGNDRAKFQKFALLFVSSLQDVLGQVDLACAREDMESLAGLGHRAKSTSMNVGAVKLSKQCLLLEQTAKANDRAAAVELGQGLRALFDDVHAAIMQRLLAA